MSDNEEYVTCKVEISKDELKEYMAQWTSEEEAENMNMSNEIVEVVNGILQDHFSDFYVTGENTIEFGF